MLRNKIFDHLGLVFFISLASLCLPACSRNEPTPQRKEVDFSKYYTGSLYTYQRDYAPGSHSTIQERYDTFSVFIFVERSGDSIRFITSNSLLMPDCTFDVSSPSGTSHRYWLHANRPMENYCLTGDTLTYFYSAADPGSGHYLSTKNFFGIVQH